MNIIECIEDPKLFQPFLGDLDSWEHWLTALRTLYGLKPEGKKSKKLIHSCTGRFVRKLPADGFDVGLFLTGRRSGKSRIAAVIAAYEATISGNHKKLDRGEIGMVPILSPSKSQSRIVKSYLREVFETPLLRNLVAAETSTGIELKTGVRIETFAGDWRTIRGFTLLCAVVDEVAFFGVEAESKVKSDTELIRAIQPALATTGGKLIAISSPYARRGWAFEQFEKNHGNDDGVSLVWNAPSRTMNPTLPEKVIKRAMKDDAASARAEYLGEFRDDVSAFVPREVIQACVIKGRLALMADMKEHDYFAFVDISGGRSDDSALCVAHREKRTVVIDLVKRYKAPHNPNLVISEMVTELARYGITRVAGDNYSAEFVASAFRSHHVSYQKSKLPKSGLYLELLPRLCSKEIELVDDKCLIDQLARLERRTRSGGKDMIDHPPKEHDDVANAVAGAAVVAAKKRVVVGCFSLEENTLDVKRT